MQPQVVYEDKDLMVICKPAGMVVNNAQTVREPTVQDWFNNKINKETEEDYQEFMQKGGIVHRLDKETSGLMVLAKNGVAYNFLKKQFMERNVQKLYTCLVHGKMRAKEGIIKQPIVRHPTVWGKFTIGEDLARMAITNWRWLEDFKRDNEDFSLLEVNIMTGRTHQIRVHMKLAGHPVASDFLYSGKKLYRQDLLWCPRLFLHAHQIGFTHPATLEKVTFKAELPNDLQQALSNLVH